MFFAFWADFECRSINREDEENIGDEDRVAANELRDPMQEDQLVPRNGV